jgi:hypothetical protein
MRLEPSICGEVPHYVRVIFLPLPITSSLLGLNTPLSTPLSDTLSVFPSLNVADKVLTSTWKTYGQITVLYVLIFVLYIEGRI